MSSEGQLSRHLSFTRIATTEIAKAPVIEAEFDDTESWLIFIPDEETGCIRVMQVVSRRKGDMAQMLDEIVAQLDETSIRFMNPLDDFKLPGQPRLIDRLRGFERTVETFDGPNGQPIEIGCYVGEWETNDA